MQPDAANQVSEVLVTAVMRRTTGLRRAHSAQGSCSKELSFKIGVLPLMVASYLPPQNVNLYLPPKTFSMVATCQATYHPPLLYLPPQNVATASAVSHFKRIGGKRKEYRYSLANQDKEE